MAAISCIANKVKFYVHVQVHQCRIFHKKTWLNMTALNGKIYRLNEIVDTLEEVGHTIFIDRDDDTHLSNIHHVRKRCHFIFEYDSHFLIESDLEKVCYCFEYRLIQISPF